MRRDCSVSRLASKPSLCYVRALSSQVFIHLHSFVVYWGRGLWPWHFVPKIFTVMFIFLNCSGCKLSNWKLCYFYYSVFQQHPGCCKPIAISGIYWGNCRITWVGADTIQCKLLVGYSYNLTAITSHVKLVMEHDQLLSCSDSSGIKMTPCWCVILFSQEIRTAAIRTLTALVHMECSPRYAKKLWFGKHLWF